MSRFLEYLAIYIVMILAQTLLFDNLQLTGYLNIIIYPIFMLLLPFNMKSIGLLFCGLLLGITADLWNGSLGLYTMVFLLLGYLRPLILNQVSKIDARNSPSIPRSSTLGLWNFLLYTFTLTFIMFACVIFLERLTFDYMLLAWMKVFVSSIVSTIVIFFIQLPLNKFNKSLFRDISRS